ILPAVYLHFALEYVQLAQNRQKLIRIYYFISIVLILFVFSPWFLSITYRPTFGFYITKPRMLYPVHIALFIGAVIYIQVELLINLVKSSGEKKNQIKYFLIATMIGYSGGMTNYLINYDVKMFPLYPFGNYTILLYVVIIGFNILRNKFMDIQV